jgi:hypothetical protein
MTEGHHLYGTPRPWPPRSIPGDEVSTIGTRFEMMPNGEIHLVEVCPNETSFSGTFPMLFAPACCHLRLSLAGSGLSVLDPSTRL